MPSGPLFATIALFISRMFFYFPCEHPVTYRLGSIDPRFGLSPTAAAQNAQAATGIWGQQYFRLDPEAKLTINFVYDQRQGLATQINTSEDKIASDKATLANQIDDFNARLRNYEQQVAALNSEIDTWNRQGGAPEGAFQQLVDQQQQLKVTQQTLQAEGRKLNQAAKNFNLQVNELNSTISSFNTLIGQKPEEGLFNGPENLIEIYFVNSKSELVHTLAHEFGHALGMGHVDNRQAIMYSYTSESLAPTAEDQAELTRACTKINKLQILAQLLKTQLRSWYIKL